MRLDHEFTVPAPIDDVWQALLDPERVAPCMPGATLTGVEGDEFSATMKVKLGPVSMQYKGKGEFTGKDEAARRLVIKASGKETRGSGTASAEVAVTLTEDSGMTVGSVATEMSVTGKPAQFGRGMISEVGGRLIGEFAACLAERLAPPAATEPAAGAASDPGSGAPTEPGSPQAPSTGSGPAAGTSPDAANRAPAANHQAKESAPIDLMDVAGAPVAKRLAPILAGVAAVAAIIMIVRARRK